MKRWAVLLLALAALAAAQSESVRDETVDSADEVRLTVYGDDWHDNDGRAAVREATFKAVAESGLSLDNKTLCFCEYRRPNAVCTCRRALTEEEAAAQLADDREAEADRMAERLAGMGELADEARDEERRRAALLAAEAKGDALAEGREQEAAREREDAADAARRARAAAQEKAKHAAAEKKRRAKLAAEEAAAEKLWEHRSVALDFLAHERELADLRRRLEALGFSSQKEAEALLRFLRLMARNRELSASVLQQQDDMQRQQLAAWRRAMAEALAAHKSKYQVDVAELRRLIAEALAALRALKRKHPHDAKLQLLQREIDSLRAELGKQQKLYEAELAGKRLPRSKDNCEPESHRLGRCLAKAEGTVARTYLKHVFANRSLEQGCAMLHRRTGAAGSAASSDLAMLLQVNERERPMTAAAFDAAAAVDHAALPQGDWRGDGDDDDSDDDDSDDGDSDSLAAALREHARREAAAKAGLRVEPVRTRPSPDLLGSVQSCLCTPDETRPLCEQQEQDSRDWAARSADENARTFQLWRDSMMQRLHRLRSDIQRMLLIKARIPIDDPYRNTMEAVRKLAEERRKLTSGRAVLEAELARRLQAAAAAGGDDPGCAFCRAQEDINRLDLEVKRLEDELQLCKAHPRFYRPHCAEDLRWQIGRLREEIGRRRAVLYQEELALKKEISRLRHEQQQCDKHNKRGCPESDRARLRLELKSKQTELAQREVWVEKEEQRIVFSCMWRFRDRPMAPQISGWFRSATDGAFFNASMRTGCERLKELKAYAGLYDCICADFEKQDRALHKALQQQEEEAAAEKAAAAAEVARKAAETRKRRLEKEKALEVAKTAVYDLAKKSTNFEAILQQAAKGWSAAGNVLKLDPQPSLEAKPMPSLRKQACHAGSKTAPSGNLLRDCLVDLPPVARLNLQKAFACGSQEVACSLLSIGSERHDIRAAYTCLCDKNR